MNTEEWRAKKKTTQVLCKRMAYIAEGSGDPIVLLRGNPTSSFLRRDVVPPLEALVRCILHDLIGMGTREFWR